MREYYPIDVTLRVEVKDGMVAVRPRFTNANDVPTLVMEGMDGFGIRGTIVNEPLVLMNDEYTVITGGKKLRYIGPIYKREPYTKQDFSVMQPGEVIEARYDRLDATYEFVLGEHEYEVIHHHLQYDTKTDCIIRVNSRPAKLRYTRHTSIQ